MDSPLSKAGKLEIYIHTEANVTVQVRNPLPPLAPAFPLEYHDGR